jgi:peroxiredoxin 2/4
MAVLVGKEAPDFDVKAVVDGNEIVNSYTLHQCRGKYVVLFFYPKDFTFVCPTELHAFQDKLSEFEARDVQVLGCSVDSEFSHHAWLNTPKGKGGIEGVKYPLLADFNKTIARDYDVLDDGSGAAYRGLFLIDTNGVVKHQLVNDMPLGRSVEEALRLVDALQYVEKHGEVCPANWTKGDRAMTANKSGLDDYFGG